MKKAIIITIIFAFILWNYVGGLGDPVDADSDREVVFTVEPGQGGKQISANLKSQGLIKSDQYFNFYIWKSGLQSKLQAGDYVLQPSMSTIDIAGVLMRGDAIQQERTMKMIEGWNLKDMNAYLKKNGFSDNNEFLELTQTDLSAWSFDFSKPDFLRDAPSGSDLEGYLFPDTYKVFLDAEVPDLIRKMVDNFDAKLTPEMRRDIASQGKSIYEIITMASVIEKEVRTEDDMRVVSGIFWNRLKSGQALESCATLAYILGENKKQYTLEDTKVDSPYNTYQNRGLPPGPICNPGLKAINAAIYPENTEYYYFLNRFDTGETVFSRTYDEHLINKEKYLQ